MSQLIDKLKKIKPVRALVYMIVGSVSYPGLAIFNNLKIEGTEHIKDLPKKNVLFVLIKLILFELKLILFEFNFKSFCMYIFPDKNNKFV